MHSRTFLIVSLLLTVGTAGAIPRYSAQYNQSCVLCHVDPSGGGARSLYGAQFFAYTELAAKQVKFEDIGMIKPNLNDQIQIGFDARTMFYGTDDPATNTFMQMQGDLYLIFQLSKQWSFMLDKGLYSGFEAWGMGHIFPYNGYVKVGRFTPPYGLRLADHKAFVRDSLGMGYGFDETGIEFGLHPEHFTLNLAVTNGTRAFQDTDEAKAVTFRADVRVPLGGLRFWLGVTGRRNGTSPHEDMIGGGYGGISLGKFNLLGEVDYRDYLTKSLVSFTEASYKVYRGITLKAEYDFYDSDIHHKTGAESMYLGGAEIVPTGFLQIIPNVRFHDRQPGSNSDYYEAEIQLHIFY